MVVCSYANNNLCHHLLRGPSTCFVNGRYLGQKLNVAIVVGCYFTILEPDAKLNLKSTDDGIICI